MAKTITRFKTIHGNPIALVAANIFSVKRYEGPQLDIDTMNKIPATAIIYEVKSPSGGVELIVQLPGDSVMQHVAEAWE